MFRMIIIIVTKEYSLYIINYNVMKDVILPFLMAPVVSTWQECI
jgi:hypothetical protein